MPDVVISGIGQSAIGRRLSNSAESLTCDSILEAIADAGLTVADIDGLSTYPGKMTDKLSAFSPLGVYDAIQLLGLKPNWYSGGGEGGAQPTAIINAYAAIKAGLARHVVVFRTIMEGSGTLYWKQAASGGEARQRSNDAFQYMLPFDALTVINWLAMYAQRHFHLYGTTREQMGAIAVNARANAALNPKAIYRDPMTLDDYMAARMISSPFCLFDCDAPTDASTAFVLSSADAARDGASYPIKIASLGCATRGQARWDRPDMPRMAAFDAAEMMWSRTDLKPADVDIGQIYDGFSFLTMNWLEALGFCGVGESGAFVEGGARIARDGDLPINTNGGQLSGGRTHGFGYIHEAVLQLRRAAGKRQVAGDPEVAVTCAGGGPTGSCLLLTR